MNALTWAKEAFKKEEQAPADPLDKPLLQISRDRRDDWTLRHAFENVLVTGEVGKGKTSGPGNTLAISYLKNGFGGLVFTFKEGEGREWGKLLKLTGREQDGLFFSADGDLRFNFLEHEAKVSGLDFVDNLVELLANVASIQRRGGHDGHDGTFWMEQKYRLFLNTISMMLMAKEPVQLRKLYEVFISAPENSSQVTDATWQETSFMCSLLKRAKKNHPDHAEIKPVVDYWTVEFPNLHVKTRQTIITDASGMFDRISRLAIGRLLSTTTNVTPEDALKGKIIVLDIPVARFNEAGQYAQLIWKILFQRAVERRVVGPKTVPVFSWCDEYHYFAVEKDARFLTSSRSQRHSHVALIQGIPNLTDAFGRSDSKVDMILGAHVTRFGCANSCHKTNEWWKNSISKETVHRYSISSDSRRPGHQNISVTEQEDFSCGEKEFLDLRSGGPLHNNLVQCVMYQSGRKLLNGQRWCVRTFKQT